MRWKCDVIWRRGIGSGGEILSRAAVNSVMLVPENCSCSQLGNMSIFVNRDHFSPLHLWLEMMYKPQQLGFL